MKKNLYIVWMIGLTFPAVARETRLEISLAGKWRFEIGDNKNYSKADFDDSNWEWARVPGCWEDFGFPGYDGFAWYRTKFVVSEALESKSLRLKLGRIDDTDQVYINGEFLGGLGMPPPDYRSAFDVQRDYYLSNDLVKFGKENVIAIQVFDGGGCGGINGGEIGLYSEQTIDLILNLAGKWHFTTGDQMKYKEINFDDSNWRQIMVPSTWEVNGLRIMTVMAGIVKKSF